MNFIERYSAGEYEAVWQELTTAGAAVRDGARYEQAIAVAHETMRRVRHNCELLVVRLGSLGYQFGIYPDGSSGYYSEGPLVFPSEQVRSDLTLLEEQVGPVPLSLRAFWLEVGSIDLVGCHPLWPAGADPLVVYPPEGALSDVEMGYGEQEGSGSFEVSLAPDDLHKDNVSGGEPYAVMLPDGAADSLLRNERHELFFVPYLRLAILGWGGFPGLEGVENSSVPLAMLREGLLPF